MCSSDPAPDTARTIDSIFSGLARLAGDLGLPAAVCTEAATRAFRVPPDSAGPASAGQGPARPELQYVALTVLDDLISTLIHNVSRDEGDAPHFQRSVYSLRIPDGATAQARARIQERATAFTEALDDELSQIELPGCGEPSAAPSRLGAGVFYFETRGQTAESSS